MRKVKRYWAQGIFGQFVSHIRYIPMDKLDRDKAIEAQRRALGLKEEKPNLPKK